MKTPAEAAEILRQLERQHPDADTALTHRNAFELLVATILSAQTTDEGVNSATPALFARHPDARSLAAADPAEVESLVLRTGFFRQKTRAIIGMAQGLVARHDGEVPDDMSALVALPGVGRKTANVVLAHALGVPGLPVDRHVLRVSNRLGLASSDDPVTVEAQLGALYRPEAWRSVSDTLILHGRRICNPKPRCDRCPVRDACDFHRAAGLADSPATSRRPRRAPAVSQAARKPRRAPARRTRTKKR
jgi:endonuclease-3